MGGMIFLLLSVGSMNLSSMLTTDSSESRRSLRIGVWIAGWGCWNIGGLGTRSDTVIAGRKKEVVLGGNVWLSPFHGLCRNLSNRMLRKVVVTGGGGGVCDWSCSSGCESGCGSGRIVFSNGAIIMASALVLGLVKCWRRVPNIPIGNLR